MSSPYTCKHCNAIKNFDMLNFDGLAENVKNVKIKRHQNFALYGIVVKILVQ